MHTPLIYLTALLSLLLSNSDLTTSYPLRTEIASHMEHTAKITPVTASPPAAHRASPQSPLEEGTSEDLDQDLADLFEEATTSFDTTTSSSNPSQQAKGKLVKRGFREWLEKGFSWLWGSGPK